MAKLFPVKFKGQSQNRMNQFKEIAKKQSKILMKELFTKNRIKFLLVIAVLFLSLNSCSKQPKLKDFDKTKLKKRYTLDIDYTRKVFDDQKKIDSLDGTLDNFVMLALVTFETNVLLDNNSGGILSSTSVFNPSNKSIRIFDYKIEQDSIIYIKIDDLKSTTEDKFVKSALLLEYGKNYEYFIIKPLLGTYKNFEFKVVEK